MDLLFLLEMPFLLNMNFMSNIYNSSMAARKGAWSICVHMKSTVLGSGPGRLILFSLGFETKVMPVLRF